MKKYFIFTLLALFTISFMSCENKNKDVESESVSPLVGTWKRLNLGDEDMFTITYKADGTFTASSYYKNKLRGNASGLWSLGNNILLMSLYENNTGWSDHFYTQRITIVSISATQLAELDDDGDPITYIRM